MANNNQWISSFEYSSRKMKELIERVLKISEINATVLICGESGTGKTILANDIHENSQRKSKPCINLGCGELNGDIIDSTFFGHVEGAFTGANKSRKGMFEAANGGTLVLNDVDLLSFASQSRLMRFLDDGTFNRLGDVCNSVSADVRMIFTTNKDLEKLVLEKKFMPDLYYRLKSWVIRVPPLRERPDDIKAISLRFLSEFISGNDLKPVQMSDEVLKYLCGLTLEGNARELRGIVQNLALFSSPVNGRILLREAMLVLFDDKHPLLAKSAGGAPDEKNQEDYIYNMLLSCDWNISKVSRKTGVSRTTIHGYIKKFNWHKPGHN